MISRHTISSFLLLVITIVCLNAQSNVQATVFDKNTGSTLSQTEVIIDSKVVAVSDPNGEFELNEFETEHLTMLVFHEQYNVLDTTITIDSDKTQIELYLSPLSIRLSELEIRSRRKELFGIRQLRDVEGTTINAGKKTEVVVLDLVTANLATNKTRQIFAQVAGLNIYEGTDGGLQLAIGGRGLDPNRTANFNTRQNGYDISADVLGYPESYYTPPAHAIREIQIVRGASSLQYGTQFGGLINFKLNHLESNNKWAWKSAQTFGSFGLFDSYNQGSFRNKKWKVNTYYNFKKGDGFRANSEFTSHNMHAQVSYQLNEKAFLTGEMTYFNYLAQQSGGLTDQQFANNPRQSTRERNWFAIDWKLYNLKYEQTFSSNSKMSLSLFALDAGRKALGFRGNINNLNENPILALDEKDENGNYVSPRDLILGTFKNYGAELRFINTLKIFNKKSVLLTGAKWYSAENTSIQGPGSTGVDANFVMASDSFPDYGAQSDYRFPNRNLALFGENIFYLNDHLSLTPGIRFEYINTRAEGSYNQVIFDNAGNPIANNQFDEQQRMKRSFVLFGLGLDYKPNPGFNLFANLSQNYRSVTFSDIRVVSPSFIIDPNISDEKGYTFDFGLRGRKGKLFSYNLGVFGVLYQDRIGIVFDDRANRVRKNIGDAYIAGIEFLVELDLIKFSPAADQDLDLKPFFNLSYSHSEYLNSQSQNVTGNQVELVPRWNLKTGLNMRFRKLYSSLQFSYLSQQYTDAQNSPVAQSGDIRNGIIGEIPAYSVADFSLSYKLEKYAISAGLNNLMNSSYFTRRATGYPGPGIIPSEGRTWYVGLELLLN